MALQDVCGFLDTPLYPKWNATASFSLPHEGTSQLFRGGVRDNFIHEGLSRSISGSPLQFFIPAPEYLAESPIQFGQISLNATMPDPTTPQHHHDSPLPSFPFPATIPLSAPPSVPLPFPLSHGTTTLAFTFQGGVIAAADTRSSCSGLVACPAVQKILPIHSHLVGTTSGTSADCALWKRILARELRLYQLRHRRRLSTGGAAKLLSHMLHPFKGTKLCVALTLCGWDEGEETGRDGGREGTEGDAKSRPVTESDTSSQPMTGSGTFFQPMAEQGTPCQDAGPASRGQQRKPSGPGLYYVCSDGTRLQGELFSVGSGSPYAYSVLDGSMRWGLSVDEAVSLAREAVYRATHRDAYSGNNVDLYHITAKGWRRRDREELKEEYYREKAREREKVEERRREREEERYGARKKGREEESRS